MKRFSEFIKHFLYITTCILIVVAANIMISGSDTLPADTLWQILLSGFLTTLVTELVWAKEPENIRSGIIKMIVHYIALCAVMIVCGCWFDWMNLSPAGIIMMLISVAVVYALVSLADYWTGRKLADEINQKLKGRYSDEETGDDTL